MLTFPKDFWWGAATSGPQSEGRFQKKHANMFDIGTILNLKFFYDRVGPDMASTFTIATEKISQLMKQTGIEFPSHLDSMDPSHQGFGNQ